MSEEEAYKLMRDAGRFPGSEAYAYQAAIAFGLTNPRKVPCAHGEMHYCVICEAEKLPSPEPQSWE